MLKSSTIVRSPLYKELRRNKLDFMVYYLRYPYNKEINCRGLPCAVVVLTMDENKKISRGISICSSNEKNFNSLLGFEIAAARVLRANKTKLERDFLHTQQVDVAFKTVKDYTDKIGIPFKAFKYDVKMTRKEENYEHNIGWVCLIAM